MPKGKFAGLASLYVILVMLVGLVVWKLIFPTHPTDTAILGSLSVSVIVTTMFMAIVTRKYSKGTRKEFVVPLIVKKSRNIEESDVAVKIVAKKEKEINMPKATPQEISEGKVINALSQRNNMGFMVGKPKRLFRHVFYPVALASGTKLSDIDRWMEVVASAIFSSRRTNNEVKVSVSRQPQGLKVSLDAYGIVSFSARGAVLPMTAVMGVTNDDLQTQVNLPIAANGYTSTLVGGLTGGGKSSLLDSIVLSLCENNSPHDLSITLIDMDAKHLSGYEVLPHVTRVLSSRSPADALAELRNISNTLLRGQERSSGKVHLVIIDEIQTITERTDSNPLYSDIRREIAHIARTGRGYRVSLIVATQRPSDDCTSVALRDSFVYRIAAICASRSQSEMILGPDNYQGVGLSGNGHFYRHGQKESGDFIGYFVDKDEVAREIRRIQDKWAGSGYVAPGLSMDDEIPPSLLKVFKLKDGGNGEMMEPWLTQAGNAYAESVGKKYTGDNVARFKAKVYEYLKLYQVQRVQKDKQA